MFGLMLVSTHRAKLEEIAKNEARHQKSIDDTLSTLRSQLATADSRGQAMAGKLKEATDALATCRNHAETLAAQITANEPFVAAGKAAKLKTVSVGTILPRKSVAGGAAKKQPVKAK